MADEDVTPDITADVVGLIAAITRRYVAEAQAAATPHGLTAMQAKALRAARTPVPMRRIAEVLQSEPSNVTPIVDRLAEYGLLERRPNPADRRGKLVAATEAGLAVIADLTERMPFAADPLAALTDDQRQTLRDLLKRVVES
ncbi:MarR family winged helix-turn-helix transcriptional regulator [Kutzneria sp. CA-103260]|uniref:MarR family winged helix-turn-helix transcriptional regulator n=1 Tax=Kutzneria sp. CA-103260 TaxID=2802641 RepID=UPI001BEFB392|nr:MarR family transcriptional regulator [Kutzneria sp. CA-103260]QUQ65843.1 MarR family transcriptional regulator [Kutzneria sp. CA-103260]